MHDIAINECLNGLLQDKSDIVDNLVMYFFSISAL